MYFSPLPRREDLLRLLDYHPETGKFYWKARPARPGWSRKWAGKEAGTVSKSKYVSICIEGAKYRAQRLAVVWMGDEIPDGHYVDHVNGCRLLNSYENLRVASPLQNAANRAPNRGKALPKGVRRMGRKYQARLRSRGELLHLGTYTTTAAALTAYQAAAKQHFGDFARIA
tara:strand:- start:1148 stop:1660 length:513 start_codon:yes stop_codon:yes gene_type:complete